MTPNAPTDLAIDAHVGTRLRTARLNAALSQGELAQTLQIDRSTVAKWESGQRSMTVGMLVRAARVLEVPISTLVPEAHAPETQVAAIQLITRTLEQQPDLLPGMLAALEGLLQATSVSSAVEN